MKQIIDELRAVTKDTKSLRGFLELLIKNKIYEPSIYLENLKDFDQNNLLLKACVFGLYKEAALLAVNLPQNVLDYRNKNDLTLACAMNYEGIDSNSEETVISALQKIATMAPQSLRTSNQEKNVWADLAQRYKIASKASDKSIVQKKYLFELALASAQASKMNTLVPVEVAASLLHYKGLNDFKYLDYKSHPTAFNCFFHSFAPLLVKPQAYKLLLANKYIDISKEIIEQARRDFIDITQNNAQYAITRPSSAKANFKCSFMYSLICDMGRAKTGDGAREFFLELARDKQWLKSLDFNNCFEHKETLLHHYVSNQISDSEVNGQIFAIILDNCGHLNSKNAAGDEPYTLAIRLGKTQLSDMIKSHIERKLVDKTIEIFENTDNKEKVIVKKNNKI